MELEFSNKAVYNFLLLGILLFIIMRAIQFLVYIFMRKKELKKIYDFYFPIAELIIWLFFIIWQLQVFLQKNLVFAFGLGLFLFIILFSLYQFALKEMLAGIVFKSSGRFSLNDVILIDEFGGKIKKFRTQSVEVETKTGKIVFIPYSKLTGSINIKSHPGETITRHSFKLKTDKNKSLTQWREILRISILQLPWSSIKKQPQIKAIAEEENFFTFDITIYALERAYFYKIENYLKKKYEYKSKV